MNTTSLFDLTFHRCVFMPERNKEQNNPPKYSFEDQFFQDVFKKDLVMNVFKEEAWGSYRHIKIEKGKIFVLFC